MATPATSEELEKDFLTGKNPLAYIPLCNSLRKQKQFTRALEFAQRGLAGDPDSIAGRTLYARLLCDLGHYEDALREVLRSESQAPDSQGLMKEKARCLIRLNRLEEAEYCLEVLISRNPMDPEVQMMNTQYRRMRSDINAGGRTSQDSVPRLMRLSNKEILQKILEQIRVHVKMISLSVVPTGAGEPALEGDPRPAEAGYLFYKNIQKACQEMEEGMMRVGLMETEHSQLIVLVRKNTLVSLCIEPTPRFGKIYHQLVQAVGQLLPEAATETIGR